MLSENESTYIPLGVIHALENPGKVPLEMIESPVRVVSWGRRYRAL